MAGNPEKRRVTQKQLARQLGLSTATVSLAMRNNPSIAKATRESVQRAMVEAGYVPHAAAASLRTGLSGIVGVSFHDIVHPFFAAMLIAIEDHLGQSGRVVFINNHRDEPERLARFITSLREHRADGLIVSPSLGTTPQMLDPLRASGQAIVFVSRFLRGYDADFVGNADISGMQRATEHLIGLGHRRIVMLGGLPGTSSGENRLTGFRRSLLGAGLPWDESLYLPGSAKRSTGRALVLRALEMDPQPTAFACFNDLIAFGAMNGLRASGLMPGRDVAVVGIDDTEEAEISFPTLTTVSNHPGRIGTRAAEQLLARLKDPDAPYRAIAIEPEITVRESCGAINRLREC